MKLSKAAFALAAVAFSLFATNAKANAWKMGPLSSQVPVIQQAQDLQETDRREVLCLSLALYHEARGLPSSLTAVAHVIQNRRLSGKYPKSICGVVWQAHQFTWTRYPVGAIIPREKASWQKVQMIAYKVISGESSDPTGGATHFYERRVRPNWASRATHAWRDGPLVFVGLRGIPVPKMSRLPSPQEMIYDVAVITAENVAEQLVPVKPATNVQFVSRPVTMPNVTTQRRWPWRK